MLGDFIAGSPREKNYRGVLSSIQKVNHSAVSRFLVNNFCTYCSNFERNPLSTFKDIAGFKTFLLQVGKCFIK